jgi:hypothetical protein
LAVIAVVAVTVSAARAEEGKTTTKIVIQEKLCCCCVQKIRSEVEKVPEAGSLNADMKDNAVLVTSKGPTEPSPGALWEAVEKAGKTPTKLICPAGVFDSKPKN